MYFSRLITGLVAVFVSTWGHAEETAERPARPAQCFLEVKGIRYAGGNCLFKPLDKVGSFRIEFEKGSSAQVRVKAGSAEYVDKLRLPGTDLRPWPGSKEVSTGSGDASWSGPEGGDATTIPLGESYNNQRGCWVGYDPNDPIKETSLCAWDKSQRLYLGPTPVEPNWTLAWGERQGMYARIISSSGLNTENASITAEKSRDGAIIWCRVNRDYSSECIRHTLEDDTQFTIGKKATLHANCKTKKYTDFVGRNLQALDDDILDLDTNDKISNSAGGTSVATTAFEALCPEAAGAIH
ncbi:MAG: hypothetical protein KGK01_08915 [Bradyrhizobium sp.]|uniref:hypothetical protein n=1 Tax=Bradyrhizobium sp. TaxID=376 RepID=UPI001C2930C0|nr:hypothetical protein [Bradyrhizobium sp.]MBU6461454.1 hypothetical protein [Pseudomonadota bacterium]MDE2068516.1 hypothetical protein [Bradyrhizobium sp.]MDE2242547.1 hypothetical protein [Bradyrhizobium sp.]MDE2472223.1 hypothetical protein [Bradyrhizobium sp.]